MLRARIITGGLYGVVLTATLLFAPQPAAAALLGALWLVGAWEWGRFAGLAGGPQVAYAALVASVALASFFWLDGWLVSAVLGIALAGWLLALVLVLTYPRPLARRLVACAGFVALVPSWLLLVRLLGDGERGAALALTLLAIVWAADVGAFACGRLVGRTKLAPAVSPGKTWEGVTGGLVAAAIAAGAAAVVLELPGLALAGVGVVTAAVSVLGDLTESLFKRNVGLKDSGQLLPGHGGVLDRIDSLTAAIPVYTAGLYAAGLLGHP